MKQAAMQLEELCEGPAKGIAAREAVETVVDDLRLRKIKVERLTREPGNLSRKDQPLQSKNIVHHPSLANNQNTEIAKIVQKLLQPNLPEHPTGIPPSRYHTNKILLCQICRFTVDKTDTVLVCDACEKGFHLKCLQPSLIRKNPRDEWHCTKCLIFSGEKPLPSKYGRVVRFSNTKSKLPSDTDKKPDVAVSKLAKHLTWSPPPRDFMNQAFTCQICELTVNEVDTVLLCDACEKGFHLKCLQLQPLSSSLLRGIPKGDEWHCMRCLSGQKPLFSKYGRVFRLSKNAPKLCPNSGGVQPYLEKKTGVASPEVSPQELAANSGSGLTDSCLQQQKY